MSTFLALGGVISLVLLAVTVLLLWRRRDRLPREATAVLTLLIVFLAFSRLSDAIAYFGLSIRLESLEDHLLIVAPALWCFALYALERDAEHRKQVRATQEVRALLEQAPAAVWTTDLSLRITSTAGRGFEVLSVRPDDLIGRRIPDILREHRSGVVSIPDDPENPDGADDHDSAAWLTEAHERALAGEVCSAEGEWSSRTLRMRIMPLRDSDGRIRGAIGVWLDATEQKRLEVELHRAQTMEAVGRLASGVAHDLNNMLTVIVGAAGLVDSMLPKRDKDAQSDPLAAIEQASSRAVGLTRQLLTFARRERTDPRTLDLGVQLRNMRQMLAGLAGDCPIQLDVDADTPPVSIDQVQFEQVISNLVVNARDASQPTAPIQIRLQAQRPTDLSGDGEHVWGGPVDGPAAWLTVADSGRGIDPAALPHLFEPFFTTKSHGRGTGLGLATVYGVVTRAGGCIIVKTAPGEGSAFTVCLPAARDRPAPLRPPLSASAPVSGLRLLLVEDEPLVRGMTAKALQAAGFRVDVAANLAEATRLITGAEHAYDGVVTDLMLPDGDGIQVIAQVRGRWPVGVVVVTGLPAEASQRIAGIENCRILAKPFLPQELIAALDSVRRGPARST